MEHLARVIEINTEHNLGLKIDTETVIRIIYIPGINNAIYYDVPNILIIKLYISNLVAILYFN